MLLLLQGYINIYGYKEITIKLMPISGFNVLLKLNKQRYKCKNCNKTFITKTNIVKSNRFFKTMLNMTLP